MSESSSEHVLVHRHLACFVLGCIASLVATRALAAPDPNWTAQSTMSDCSGPGQQGTASCESYATDFYEHIAYASSGARTADIAAVRAGFDADYYYFEYDFVDPWSPVQSTGHNVVLGSRRTLRVNPAVAISTLVLLKRASSTVQAGLMHTTRVAMRRTPIATTMSAVPSR